MIEKSKILTNVFTTKYKKQNISEKIILRNVIQSDIIGIRKTRFYVTMQILHL